MYLDALKIAYNAHKGQIRRESCVPYIVHPLRLANHFNDDIKKTVAILHDTIEDTALTFKDLSMFPTRVTVALDALSRRKGENHFDYIRRLKKNEIAREIKIVDIVDNLSDCLSVHPPSMIKRYDRSLEILIT